MNFIKKPFASAKSTDLPPSATPPPAASPPPVSSSSRSSSSATTVLTPNDTSSLASAGGTAPPALPRLVVFDLDYTLWPFWVDTHVAGPVRAGPATTAVGLGSAGAVDRSGEGFDVYADVPRILWALADLGVPVAVASRSPTPDLARDLLKAITIRNDNGKPRRLLDLFDGGVEIYPTSKLRHMDALARRNAVAFEDVLFFDDERRNAEVESLGVTMYLVRDGISWDEFVAGLERWQRRRRAVNLGKLKLRGGHVTTAPM